MGADRISTKRGREVNSLYFGVPILEQHIGISAKNALRRPLGCSRHHATMIVKSWNTFEWSKWIRVCPVCVHVAKVKVRLARAAFAKR